MSRRGLLLLIVLGAGGCVPAPAPQPLPPPPARPPVVPAPAPSAAFPRYALAAEPLVDVALRWDVDSLRFEPLEEVALERVGPFGRAEEARTTTTIIVRRVSAGALVEIGGERAFMLADAETLLAGSAGDRPARAVHLAWGGHSWRGTLKAFLNPRGKLTLVNRLPLEAYLLGVVPGEIGALSEELLEAGKAQAIAARSYTLFYRGRRSAEGFDVYGTVEDQVFGPVESETPLASRCVEETRALVALSREQPIRANYSSTCGGITAEAWEAWPAGPFDYLSVRRDRDEARDYCADSRHYRWTERFKPDEFVGNLRRFCPERGVPLPAGGLGKLLDVRTLARSRSGRVWRLEVVTTTGRVVIPAHELRWVVRRAGQPGAILRSTLVKVDVRRDPTTREPLEVVVSGGGSGHGVGLCQVGALGMARSGHAAARILEHYYKGIEVRALY